MSSQIHSNESGTDSFWSTEMRRTSKSKKKEQTGSDVSNGNCEARQDAKRHRQQVDKHHRAGIDEGASLTLVFDGQPSDSLFERPQRIHSIGSVPEDDSGSSCSSPPIGGVVVLGVGIMWSCVQICPLLGLLQSESQDPYDDIFRG
jgi:hypothetical protein